MNTLEHRFGVVARTINSIVFIVVQCISVWVILCSCTDLGASVASEYLRRSSTSAYLTSPCIPMRAVSRLSYGQTCCSRRCWSSVVLRFLPYCWWRLMQEVLSPEHLNIINLDFDLGADTCYQGRCSGCELLWPQKAWHSTNWLFKEQLATKNVKTAQNQIALWLRRVHLSVFLCNGRSSECLLSRPKLWKQQRSDSRFCALTIPTQLSLPHFRTIGSGNVDLDSLITQWRQWQRSLISISVFSVRKLPMQYCESVARKMSLSQRRQL